MKKLLFALVAVALMTACAENDEINSSVDYVVTGYNETELDTRTAFDTPKASTIPFLWTSGDYIWLGSRKSDAITSDCQIAQFAFSNGQPAIVGTGHVFYNMTSSSNNAYVLANQTADGNLGNDGDFGYATLDAFGSFCLKHKTSYIWFDTTTDDADMPKLTSIKLDADGVNIAGQQTYDFTNDEWSSDVTEGSSTITLKFAGGHTLVAENEGVMAAMVCLPAAISGKTLTITYTFEGGSIFTETKKPTKNLAVGATTRIKTKITKDQLYELRVLTFEDEDKKFDNYRFQGGDGDEYEITTWSDLIPENQWYEGSPLIYNMGENAEYEWYDANNTELYHIFPSNYGMQNYAGGGAVISSHTVELEAMGEYTIYNYQVSVTCGGGNNGSENFCVAYNVSEVDPENYDLEKTTLEFGDGEARVIDHMYVTIAAPTHYCILYGNSFSAKFGEDDFLKLVATGVKEDNTETEPIEIMLAERSDYKITDWTKWDLSGLGEVIAVKFHMEEAQKVSYSGENGPYYYKTPLYFAFDDIAVRFEE